MAIVATYKGDGTAFLNGVPARNLTDEDWALLDDEQRETVRKSDLYSVAERRATTAEAKAKEA